MKKKQQKMKKNKQKTTPKNKKKRKKKEENADVKYYTPYPKTPEIRLENPNLWLRVRAHKGVPFSFT